MFNSFVIETIKYATRRGSDKLQNAFFIIAYKYTQIVSLQTGKKNFWNSYVYNENRVCCWMILWCGSWFALVLSCRGNAEIDLYISCRTCTDSETNTFVGEIRNLILDKGFLSKYLLLHQLLPTKQFTLTGTSCKQIRFLFYAERNKKRFTRTFSFLLSLYLLICTFL